MMKHYIMLAVFMLSVSFLHAQEVNNAAIPGFYKGNFPCEECKIIETELELKYGTDSTGEYSLRDKYVSKGGTDVMSRMTGDWIVTHDIIENKKANVVILNYDNEDKAMYYLLKADGNLLPLDKEKHVVVADIDCTLRKTH